MTRRAASAGVGAAFLSACSPLSAFNALSPRPAGVRRTANLAYGPLARQRLDIYAPIDAAAPAPLMVFLYGGGWESGAKADYAFAGRAYAARGFVVAVPDYRLAPEAPYPAFLEDCARAVAWCQANAARHGADPARTALAGHSAGAYNAAMLALDRRWLAQAGAPRPIRAWAGLSGPYDFLPLEPGPGLRTFGRQADLRATQPISYARRDAPPAFLACGEADKVVRPRNTRNLAERLRADGVRVESHIYPGVGHPEPLLAMTWPLRLRLPVLAQSAAFLHAVLSPSSRDPGEPAP